MMLRVEDLTKYYFSGNERILGICDVDINLKSPGLVAVVGSSGSGKTTLLNLLAGLDSHSDGAIYFDEECVSEFTENEWDQFRNEHMGIVFQTFNLIEDMNVYENIALPLQILDTEKARISDKVNEALCFVNLAGYQNRKVCELSAGQRQRVAIARAIVKKPDILLADELTGNLDEENSKMIFELLERMSRECLVIAVTHDVSTATGYADRILCVENGRIIKDIDNSRIKELSQNKHKIFLYDSDNNVALKTYSFLGDVDWKHEILKICDHSTEGDEVTISVQIQLDTKEKDIEEPVQKEELRGCKLPFFYVLKMALANMRLRKVRLGIAYILFVFTSVLFLITSTISRNDYMKALGQYLESEGLKYMSVTYQKEVGSQNIEVSSGKNLYTALKELFAETDVFSCLEHVTFIFGERDDMKCIDVDLLFIDEKKACEEWEIVGRLPRGAHEILLDVKSAGMFGLTADDYAVEIRDEDGCVYEVVGILLSGIEQDRYYSVMSREWLAKKGGSVTQLECQGNDLLQGFSVENYANSGVLMGSIEELKQHVSEEDLVYGRYPQKKNEVVVSEEYASLLGYEGGESFATKVRLFDLHAEKYHGQYDDRLNFYSLLGKHVEVVGIYSPESCEYRTEASIYIDGEILKDAIADYYEYFISQRYLVDMGSYDYVEKVREAYNKDLYITIGSSEVIYSTIATANELRKEILVLACVCLLAAVLMMISYIAYNIKDHAKKIGVLRAMGVSRVDITKIFLCETILLCMATIVASVPIFVLCMTGMNAKGALLLNVMSLKLFQINWTHVLAMSVVILGIGILINAIPCAVMVRKKSIRLFREDSVS